MCIRDRSGRIDPYLRAFFSGIAHRKSCNECKFKGRRRYSDITLFDCGRYCELTGDNDDDLGHTSVLVNTKKGEKLLLELGKEEVVFSAIDRGMGEQLNGKMIEGCTPKHPDVYKRQVLPSYDEGFPVSIIEAMAAGNAVVSTCAVSYTHLDVYKRQVVRFQHGVLPGDEGKPPLVYGKLELVRENRPRFGYSEKNLNPRIREEVPCQIRRSDKGGRTSDRCV